MWKLSPKILFLSLTCIMMLINGSRVNAVKLRCQYYPGGFTYEVSGYCQFLNDNNIFTGSRVTIDSVEVTNLGSNSIDDIKALNIVSIPSLNYFPENLAAHFKNILAIQVDTSSLQEIRQSDLMSFTKLKYLFLRNNKIITIDKNTFQYNPELKLIYFNNNQISHIDPNVFDHLSHLTNLQLDTNKCKTSLGNAGTRPNVLNIIEKIRNGECSSETFLQKKKEAQDQLIKNAKLQAENDFKTNLTELQNKLTSIEQSNEDFKKQNQNLMEQLNAANMKNQELTKSNDDLTKNLIELQDKYAKKEQSVNELNIGKQICSERMNEIHESLRKCEQPISDLNIKNQICSEKLIEMHHKYEDLLSKKLTETEVMVEKLKGKIPKSENADVDDEQKNGECLTLFFSPQQRPIILSN